MDSTIDIDYRGEFGPELSTVVPYAYYLFRNEMLGRVTTGKDMECFYFFAPSVDACYTERVYLTPNDRSSLGLPNPDEHKARLDLERWIAPPLRATYRNQTFRWSKPTLVISNKFNREWQGEPVNYIGLDELQTLFELLGNDYKIVYNRPLPDNVVSDNSDTHFLEDHDLVSNFSEITTMQDLHASHPDLTFNELQLRVYANCQNFISVQGGNAVLASYFGGVNVVKVRRGEEIRRGDYRYFDMFAGTTVLPCSSQFMFMRAVNAMFTTPRNRFEQPVVKAVITWEYRIRVLSWTVLRFFVPTNPRRRQRRSP